MPILSFTDASTAMRSVILTTIRNLTVLGGVVASLSGGLTGCGSDSTSPVRLDRANVVWALRVNQHAVTLAVDDTMQLHATARNPQGDSIPLTGAVHYQASDSSIIVNANGLITGKYETVSRSLPAFVIASLTDAARNTTLTDTVFVMVTSTRPSPGLQTFSVQLDPSNSSTTRALDVYGFTNVTITPTVLDSTGITMENVLVSLTSSDRTIMTVDNYAVANDIVIINGLGGIVGRREGTATVYGEAWAYGVAKRDSVRFTWTNYSNVNVQIFSKTPYNSSTPVLYFSPQISTIAVGGVVTWQNNEYSPIDVVFDDPAHVDSSAALDHPSYGFPYTGVGGFTGLFTDTTAANNGDTQAYLFHLYKARRFTAAGTYRYHSTIYGSTGTIVVK